MTNNLRDEIARREKICEAATAAKWVRHVYQSGTVSVATSGKCWIDVCFPKRMVADDRLNWTDDKGTPAEIERLANAAFIAHARTGYPEVLAALADAVAALEELGAFYHDDRTCSLEAQGYDQLDCERIAAQDKLAQLARAALAQIAGRLGGTK